MQERMKQVIILRKDLNMRKGKMIAQGAHASMKAYLDFKDHPDVIEWLQGKFTKIAVSVDSETELTDIYFKAHGLGFPVSIIEDSGLTEFGGHQTITAVAIGPGPREQIDTVTGHLKLL